MAEQLDTTHTLMAGTLLVYQRERSAIWQCRFKVDDVWQRASTKERDYLMLFYLELDLPKDGLHNPRQIAS